MTAIISPGRLHCARLGFRVMPTRTAPKPDTTTAVPPIQLNTYHRNARKGDIDAIARSLKKLSQYKPLTGNIGTHTGRPNEILAGNHTLLALRMLAEDDPADSRWQQVKVHWVDVDEDQAKQINLADNRIAELGGYDNAELIGLLKDIPAADLSNIGYTQKFVNDLDGLINGGVLDDFPNVSDDDSDQDYQAELECPACHHVFVPAPADYRQAGD